MGTNPSDEVEVRIVRGGEVIVDSDAAASWDEPWYPNGEQCGGSCVSGGAWIDARS